MLLKVGQILPLEGKRWLVLGVARAFITLVAKEDSERLFSHFKGPEQKQFRFVVQELEHFKAGEVYTQDYEYLELQQIPQTALDQWLRLYTYQRIYRGEKRNDNKGTTSGADQTANGTPQGGGEGSEDGASTGGSSAGSANQAIYKGGRGREEGTVVHSGDD